MEQYLGVTPGSVTPLGLINDKDKAVRVLFDRDVLAYDEFACHPCINSASVILRLKDMTDKVVPATGHDITWVTLPDE